MTTVFGPEASYQRIKIAIASVCNLLWTLIPSGKGLYLALYLQSSHGSGVSGTTERVCHGSADRLSLAATLPQLHLEPFSSRSPSSTSRGMRAEAAANSSLEHRSRCLSDVALLLVPLHNHFYSKLRFYNSGSKSHRRVLLCHLRGFQVVTRALGTVQRSSPLPDALPGSGVPYRPWRPAAVSSEAPLSFLSAGASGSQGDGGGEEPLVSQEAVPGCCHPVPRPACSGPVAGGERKQSQTVSESRRLSFLTPWAPSLLHEHLFLVAGGEEHSVYQSQQCSSSENVRRDAKQLRKGLRE